MMIVCVVRNMECQPAINYSSTSVEPDMLKRTRKELDETTRRRYDLLRELSLVEERIRSLTQEIKTLCPGHSYIRDPAFEPGLYERPDYICKHCGIQR